MAVLTEEETLLRDAAKAWVTDRAPVSALRQLRDGGLWQAGYVVDAWAEMGELGWAGAALPEAFGGAGLGYRALGVVMEELGRTLVASPLLSTTVAGACLGLGGIAAQKAAWLPRIASGALVAALAVDEAAHHDPALVAMQAQREGDAYVLSGKKRFVADGGTAGLLVVAARTHGEAGDTAGLTLFLVEAGATGLQPRPLHAVDSRGAADLVFDHVRVDAASVLGTAGAGWAVLEAALDRARAMLAAEMLGTAQQAFEVTLEYMKTRRQFGQLIGSFQALQHRAAKMFTELELTRSAVEAALAAIDGGAADVPLLCSLAKARANDTLHLVSNEMVQLHGGIGMTDAADPGLYLKRARVAEALYGGSSFHRDRFARLCGY
jgi:alkylation response protein AidB-like acyl-CoA dehydrogenase